MSSTKHPLLATYALLTCVLTGLLVLILSLILRSVAGAWIAMAMMIGPVLYWKLMASQEGK
jgi:hypothetical protein